MKGSHCRVAAKKKQYWNLKYQIPNLIFSNIYELNILNTKKAKVLN